MTTHAQQFGVKRRLLQLFGLDHKHETKAADDVLNHIVNGLSDRLLVRVLESLTKEKQYEFLIIVNSGASPERCLEWIGQNVPEFLEWLRRETNNIRDKVVG